MNKKITKVLLVLVLFMPLTLLSACSSTPDGKELFKEVCEQLGDLKSMNMKMDMTMKAKAVMGDSTLKMGMDIEGDFNMTNYPIAGHGDMTMNVDMLGMKQSVAAEMYFVNKEDALYTYQNSNDEGWTVSKTTPYNEITELPSINNEWFEYLDLKVKNGEKVNKQETWQLDITMKSDMLKEMMEKMDDKENALDVFEDLEDIDITLTMFVDKKTKQMLKMSMDLKNSFSELIGKVLMKESEFEGYEFAFEELKMDIVYSKINEIDAIEVPEEVIESAMQDTSMAVTSGDTSTQTHAWETQKVVLDGKEITLGETNLRTLLDMGYVIDEEYYEVVDELEEYDSEYISLLKGDISLGVSVDNLKESTIKLNEGIITNISGYQENIILPANIKVGSSKEEVVAAYGEANTIDTSYSEIWNYEMYKENISGYLTLCFEDGKVSDINLTLIK